MAESSRAPRRQAWSRGISRWRFDDLSQAKPYDHVVVGNKDPCQVRSLSNAPLRQASTSRTSHPLGKPLVILESNTDHVGETRPGSWAALGVVRLRRRPDP